MKKLAKWFLVRLPIAFIILGVIFAITLKMVERYPAPLKEGFEEFLSQATQTNATITTVNEVKFFPIVDIDLAEISFHDLENAAVTDLSLERGAIKLPFWSSIIGARRLDSLIVEDLKATAGMILPHDLRVKKAEIVTLDGPEQYGTFLIANGEYHGNTAQFEMKMEKVKKGYKIPKDLAFSLNVGVYTLSSEVVKSFSKTSLKNAVFQKNETVSEAVDYSLSSKGDYNKENPLSCIIEAENINECDIYLGQ